MAVVYGLCRVSNPTIRYVGLSNKTAEERFLVHCNNSRSNRRLPVYDWMRKYDDVMFVVLHDGVSLAEARELEKQEIATRDNLLNLTTGGDGVPGYVYTDEVRARMSASQQGRRVSQETIARISAKHKGKVLSEDHRRKLSEAKLGKKRPPFTEETRAKMSAASKEKRLSVEARAKLSAANMGKVLSVETRAKISEARKGTTLSEETRAKMSAVKKAYWETRRALAQNENNG